MHEIAPPAPSGKADSPREKKFLLNAIFQTYTRARLAAVELGSIGVALQGGAISCDEAMKWLADEDLLSLIEFGPAKAAIHWQSPSWKRAIDEYHANRGGRR